MLQETLTQILLLLSVTIAILVVFRRLGIPGSLGFLVVGILLSTKTAGPAIQSEAITTIAEFGIVFLLFSIGLGLSVSQIYALRHTILKLRDGPGRADHRRGRGAGLAAGFVGNHGDRDWRHLCPVLDHGHR